MVLMRRLGCLGRLTASAATAVVLAGVSTGSAMAGPVTSRASDRLATTLSSTWASGYYALPKTGGATSFTHVQATFTVPAVNCASAPSSTAQMRAGLGGFSTRPIERVGISASCKKPGTAATYVSWYQMYPAAAVNEFIPKPGDTLNYSVTYAKGLYTLSIQDVTSGEAFSVSKQCAKTCPNTSAQVTAGSPQPPPKIPPANFGAVNFHVIIVTDNAGVSGGLSGPDWNTAMTNQAGTPHTVAGPLGSSGPPPQSQFQDTWAA
jgi:hypothetical protein